MGQVIDGVARRKIERDEDRVPSSIWTNKSAGASREAMLSLAVCPAVGFEWQSTLSKGVRAGWRGRRRVQAGRRVRAGERREG